MDNKTRTWREDQELRRNGEHYPDPTAYEAIKRAQAESDYERYKKLLGCIYRVAELSGYYIEDIVIKNKRTGKTWTK